MEAIELSVIMPCLNEERTLGTCIDKARACIERLGIRGEVIIADNNSTDSSADVARAHGARVVPAVQPGYGAAILAGIDAARGQFVIMGDADDSYDFSSLAPFVESLRAGADLVIGNRFSGGIAPGAMPPLHRYLGNPLLSAIGRLFFGVRIADFHCGLRGFNRARIMALGLHCPGMEFASEMVVKAALAGYAIREVPTTLAPDGRDRPPHLRSFRDGWRHLQFLMLYSPRWLFLYPGLAIFLFGGVATLRLMRGPVTLGTVTFDIHTLLYAAATCILGLQMVVFAVLIRVIGTGFGRLPERARLARAVDHFTLERGLLFGLLAALAGLAWTAHAVWQWGQADFANLDPTVTMRQTIPAVTLLIIGVQLAISSLFLGAVQLYLASRS
ncbi:MAG: glycosyltransferase family 2 protein [Pseudomonadota bacterium]